jgi:hypothetical protein
MATGNTVVLTFAGEEKPLTDSFSRVGGAATEMGDKVGRASKDLDEHGNALERTGGHADNAERNLIGVHDVIDGTATIMQGPGKQGIVAYIQGWADLAGGIAPIFEWLSKTKVATLAQAAAQKVAALGAKVWAAGQWVLNAALDANPIGLVVLAIAALVAIFVVAWKHSETFRNIVIGTWNGIKKVAESVGGWFVNTLWPWIKGVGDKIASLFHGLPSKIKSAFSGLFDILTWPYRTAFNFIADAWNNTIGRLHWSVPDWVPVIGGRSISVPNLPHFAAGGTVPGVFGEPVPIMAHGGETVSTPGDRGRGGDTVYVRGDALVDTLIELIAAEVRRRGRGGETLGIVTVAGR